MSTLPFSLPKRYHKEDLLFLHFFIKFNNFLEDNIFLQSNSTQKLSINKLLEAEHFQFLNRVLYHMLQVI